MMNDPNQTTDSSMAKSAKRWTVNILEKGGGFTPVANLFLSSYARLTPPLSAAEAMLVIHMMSRKWDRKTVEISSETLAHEMNLTPGQVRQKLRDLEEKKKILTSVVQPGQPKVYDFKPLLIKLEAMITESKADEEEDEAYYLEIEKEALKQKAILKRKNRESGSQDSSAEALATPVSESELNY